MEGFGDSGVSRRFMVVKKGDYPPSKFVVCHDDQRCAMVPVRPIYGGEVVWRGPSFERGLFWVLSTFNALFKGVFQCVPMLRSCGLNARLVRNTEASTLKEMKESLLKIKTTEWQMR